MSGTLYLCATPIGNLEDITLRVLRILKEADLIAAEDTRNSRKLLTHFDIHTPLTSYHEHNKWDKGRTLIKKLEEGQNIALITDAGMPGISDPGSELCSMAVEAGIPVTVCPGASACVTALALSGFPSKRFAFEGFLSTQKKEREALLLSLKDEVRTMIFYEAPHRLCETLDALSAAFGRERKAALCRELTKKHETVLRLTLAELSEHYKEQAPKGECVLIVGGRNPEELEREARMSWEALSVSAHVEKYVSEGMDRKEAMKQAAKDRGIGKREIYALLLEEQKE